MFKVKVVCLLLLVGCIARAQQPVLATQNGNWTAREVGNSGGVFDAAQGAAAPANVLAIGGVYNSALPTIGSGDISQIQIDSAGQILVGHIPNVGAAYSLSASAKSAVTASVNVKASAGNVYGVFALNGAASTCWVQFINSASAGTLGTAVIFSVPLPASTTQPVYIQPSPFALSNFSSGIAVGIATTATGSSACGTAGNLVVFYE